MHLNPLEGINVRPIRSSLFGRENYAGYTVDWLIQMTAAIPGFTVLITVGSLYMGLCSYINGMVSDLKARMKATSKLKRKVYQKRAWPIYVELIDFHAKTIEYFPSFIQRSEQIAENLFIRTFSPDLQHCTRSPLDNGLEPIHDDNQ